MLIIYWVQVAMTTLLSVSILLRNPSAFNATNVPKKPRVYLKSNCSFWDKSVSSKQYVHNYQDMATLHLWFVISNRIWLWNYRPMGKYAIVQQNFSDLAKYVDWVVCSDSDVFPQNYWMIEGKLWMCSNQTVR